MPKNGTGGNSHKNGRLADTMRVKTRKTGGTYMKATGIVRRIDYSVIIRAKVRSLENTGVR